MSVKVKAVAIATLGTSEQQKLDGVLPIAALHLRGMIGDDNYDAYQAMTDETSFKDKLEYAEAYLALYALAIALRDLKAHVGEAATMGFGQGQITPVAIDALIERKNMYWDEAQRIADYCYPTITGDSNIKVAVI